MKVVRQYILDYVLIVTVILLSIAGFWKIFFGADARPTTYHYLHVITVFAWLLLLLIQLTLIGKKSFLSHKTVGLSILLFGPLLVASTALMSVHSARKGMISGEGDALLVQNVMGTLELGFLILMAFVLRKRRAIHGAFLLSTTLLFMGIAIFFTLLAWVPQFKIEGPETFYRFGTAALTGLAICLVIGIMYCVKNRRFGWPVLLGGSFLLINQLINALLIYFDLIKPLTEFVGSLNETATFVTSFGVLLILLISTGVLKDRQVAYPQPKTAES